MKLADSVRQMATMSAIRFQFYLKKDFIFPTNGTNITESSNTRNIKPMQEFIFMIKNNEVMLQKQQMVSESYVLYHYFIFCDQVLWEETSFSILPETIKNVRFQLK